MGTNHGHQLIGHLKVVDIAEHAKVAVGGAHLVREDLSGQVALQQLTHHCFIISRQRRIATGFALDKGEHLLGQLVGQGDRIKHIRATFHRLALPLSAIWT